MDYGGQAEPVPSCSSPPYQQVSLCKEAPPTAYLAVKEANNMLVLRAGAGQEGAQASRQGEGWSLVAMK